MMATKATWENQASNGKTQNGSGRSSFEHAVVIGSSIAGLTAARVLAEHFDRVTIIERDPVTGAADFRRGTPQARHGHTLPLRGQRILEQLFPGLTEELKAQGATSINGTNEMAFFLGGVWHEVRHFSSNVSVISSRPLLEATIYGRVAAHPAIRILPEREVVELLVDEGRERVAGVRIRSRCRTEQNEATLAADLVLDTSGRRSRAPEWLQRFGYEPPRESTVDAFVGYATRIYRRPTNSGENWKTLFVKPSPPNSPRGGFILPIEDGRWQVSLIGMAGDYPLTDEEGFLAFARSLPTPQLYEALKEAEPLGKPYGYRQAESRVRHYDKLPRYLEGLLVGGDAVYALNPVYAQGMTAAAMGSQALEQALQAQREAQGDDINGLAGRFQETLSQTLAGLWHMVVREDRRWPTTEIVDSIISTRYRATVLNGDSRTIQARLRKAGQGCRNARAISN